MISFIIAAYNGEKFLHETVESILKQKNVETEVIIIDDASSDCSYEIASEYAQNDSRVSCYRNKENSGFCKTVNRGLQLAKGEYISILGQDDMLSIEHCEQMLKCFEQDEVVAVFCDHYLIDEKDTVFETKQHCLHREIVVKDFIEGNCISATGMVIKKNVLIEAGGYPENKEFPHYGEYHTWIRLAEKGRIVYCGAVKALYRRHSNNITNSFTEKSTIIKLESYYWSCRKQILHSKKVSLKDKIYVLRYSCIRYKQMLKTRKK